MSNSQQNKILNDIQNEIMQVKIDINLLQNKLKQSKIRNEIKQFKKEINLLQDNLKQSKKTTFISNRAIQKRDQSIAR